MIFAQTTFTGFCALIFVGIVRVLRKRCLHGGIFFVSGLVGIAIGGGNPIIGLLFLAGGLIVPWLYLGFRRKRRRKALLTRSPRRS